MRDRYGLLFIILALANLILYTYFYLLKYDTQLIGLVWAFSPYLSVCIISGVAAKYVDFKLDKRFGMWSLIVVISILLALISFWSVDNNTTMRLYSLLVQIFMSGIVLFIYTKLCRMFDMKIINSRNEKKELLDKSNAKEVESWYSKNLLSHTEKRTLDSVVWTMVCIALIIIVYFILPFSLKIFQATMDAVFYSYLVVLSLLTFALINKNNLINKHNIKVIKGTLLEAVSISVPAAINAYYNVCLCINSMETGESTTYIGPIILMGIGLGPFLIDTKEITREFVRIADDKDRKTKSNNKR